MTRWTLLVALVMLIPAATAQINGPHDFEADYGFANPSSAQFTTVLSGQLEVQSAGSTGPYGFFDADGLRVDGLDRVCRGFSNDECWTGDLSMVVEKGSAGIQFLTRPASTYTADHALALFLDARGDDLNSMPLNQSLLAPAVGGVMTFDNIPYLPSSGSFGIKAPSATITATAAGTVFVLFDGATVLDRWEGKSDLFRLYGPPSIPPFKSDFVVLPFKDDSVATVTPADAEAATQGLHFERIQQVFQMLNDASASGVGQGQPSDVGDSPLEEALAEILDAALVRFPTASATDPSEDDYAIVLFKSMDVTNQGGNLLWQGQASFEMQGSQVVDAQPLYGVWFFKLPWWGWGLWIAAIGLIVARLAVKPAKTHDRWDQYRWIGWLAGAVMFVVVLLLWDIEMRAVWGTSVITTETAGTAFWITLGLQLGTMALVMGAVSWPISIITKNTLLLCKQGNFMGLGKPVSMMLAYLLGATLMLAYIELFISSVIQNLPT